jgi:hypothetical protein
MKTKVLLIVIGMLAIGGGVILMSSSKPRRTAEESRAVSAVSPSQEMHSEATHSHASVPAYQSEAELGKLQPTLPAANFFGRAREAYAVAKEIPETLAQLPCYCHCDRSFGHKSLHTCFIDDHAAHCAVCVDEALLAYRLQKEEKKTPEQVRDIIIEKYSSTN